MDERDGISSFDMACRRGSGILGLDRVKSNGVRVWARQAIVRGV